jgi:hypothetical protein
MCKKYYNILTNKTQNVGTHLKDVIRFKYQVTMAVSFENWSAHPKQACFMYTQSYTVNAGNIFLEMRVLIESVLWGIISA